MPKSITKQRKQALTIDEPAIEGMEIVKECNRIIPVLTI
jgi:hypothetical protein